MLEKEKKEEKEEKEEKEKKEEKDKTSTFVYVSEFLDIKEENDLFIYFEKMDDFKSNPTFTNGFSRKQKWFQTEEKYFCPLWKHRYDHWKSFPMKRRITDIIKKVQNYLQSSCPHIYIPIINSCLVNKYPDGDSFIAPHSDSELSFGKRPTIIIISIGQERTLHFERKGKRKENEKTFSFQLQSRSLFIMAGSSQEDYTHSIKKEKEIKGVRYSLTFREFIL